MKECIVILGMHRSGTSVLTGLLNILGCYAGADLKMPGKDNPTGCFENTNIVRLNEKILRENDSSWDDSFFLVDTLSSSKQSEYVQLAKAIILDELKYANKILINDPRVYLLFPIWEKALTNLNITIRTIFLYRNPMEVALSLKQHDNLPVEKGLMLWSQHFFQAEYASRPYRKINKGLVVEYASDFDELDKLLDHLTDFIGLSELKLSSTHKKQAKTLYKPSMKKQNLSLTNISSDLPYYLTSLIKLLLNQNLDDDKTIDQLHQEFNQSQHFFLYDKKKQTATINELQKNYNAIQGSNSEQKALIDSHQHKLDKQHIIINDFRTKIHEQQSKLDKNHKLILSQQDKNNQQKDLVKNLQTKLDQYERKTLHLFTLGRRFKESYQITELASTIDKMRSEFDDAYYLFNNPDIVEQVIDPFQHFIDSGWKEGRDPNPLFSIKFYLENNPDVQKSGINPLQHYAETGKAQHLQTLSFENQTDIETLLGIEFDAPYYLTENSDVLSSGMDPFQHFMKIGWQEGRDPNAHFSTRFYLDCNPDVDKAGINPFEHYLITGQKEHRAAQPGQHRKIKPLSTAPSILFVGHSAAQGGAEVVLLDIIRWYAENTGYQISIILLSPGLLASEFMRYGEVLVLNNDKELTSKEAKAFLSFHYDLIYLNTVVSGGFADTYQQLYAKHNIPVVLHVHEMSKVINTFKEEFDRIVKHVDLFIAASTRVKEDLVSEFTIDPQLISVHHSFVRSKAEDKTSLNHQISAAREAFELDNEDIVIIGSGTAYWRKGTDIFVEAVSQVIKRYSTLAPDKNIVAIWMGDGEDLAGLRLQVEEQGLSGQIRFPGFVKNASELVAAANIFFLSSREDPFPLVCLEAAQFEIPIVCFEEATGMVEFVQKDAGMSLPKIDAEVAADALIHLIHNKDQRQQFGSTARNRFLHYYSSEPRIREIFLELKKRYHYSAGLTAIVPVLAHEPFLKERVHSIMNQSFYDLDILLIHKTTLGDATLDNTTEDSALETIREFKRDVRVSLLRSDSPSESIFAQWKKGIEAANSDYIWLTESGDTCSNNFAETLLQAFNDKKVVLSYCRSEVIDEDGTLISDSLTSFLETIHPTKFKEPYVLDGNIEVKENFAVACTIASASSTIFRKAAIENVIGSLVDYCIHGNWSLYLTALSQGKIAYIPSVVNSCRRSKSAMLNGTMFNATRINKEKTCEGAALDFEERYKIASQVVNSFNVDESVLQRILKEVDSQWARLEHIKKEQSCEQLFDKQRIINDHEKNYVPVLNIGFYVHGFLFSKGGIERLAADIANYLTHRGHNVTIFCRVFSSHEPVFQIDKNIKVIPVFDETHEDLSVIKLRKELRDRQLDVFVPMLSEWIFEPVIKAAEDLGFPIVSSEHNSPKIIEAEWWNHDSRVETFEKVDRIHLLREGYKQSLPKHLKNKIKVINNGSYLGQWTKARSRKTYHRILAAGRLSPQKRFDRLIKAFSIALKSIRSSPDESESRWVLDIYGEGPDANDLAELIAACDMNEYITLKGNTSQLEKEYLTSDLFVLPSEYEGDPVVLIEAKMLGLACIGYSNCAGTNEAIRHHIDGLLVKPDTDNDDNGTELAKAIVTLVQHPELRKKYGEAAMIDSKQFAMKKVAQQWENMLIDATYM